MTMRLCTTVSLCLAAAAALLSPPTPAAAAPACAGQESGAFPLTTKVYGGPDSYRAGGGYGTWYLDLRNTTRRACAGVHPVVVLVGTAHALRPSQPRLDFYADGRPHPLRFDTTDEDELVGVFGDPGGADRFAGFTVDPGETLTVELRLALTSDTVPDDITLNAAVVQRHGDDGDWIGQSNDYRFTVESGTAPAPGTPTTTPRAPDTAQPPGASRPDGGSHAPGLSKPDASPSPFPSSLSHSASPSPSPSPSSSVSGTPSLTDVAEQLARSGLASVAALLTVTLCLLAAGATILLTRHRD